MQPIKSISIPKPCHQNWNRMTPVEQGRYCTQCSKTVTDFTAMNNAEIINYFAHRDNVCGRFDTYQLENLNIYLSIIDKPRFSWKKLALAAMLTSLFATVKAQIPLNVRKVAVHHTNQKPERLPMIEALPRTFVGNVVNRADSLILSDTAISTLKNQPTTVLYGKLGVITVGRKMTFYKSFWYKLKRIF
jgi:hypothetical protein